MFVKLIRSEGTASYTLHSPARAHRPRFLRKAIKRNARARTRATQRAARYRSAHRIAVKEDPTPCRPTNNRQSNDAPRALRVAPSRDREEEAYTGTIHRVANRSRLRRAQTVYQSAPRSARTEPHAVQAALNILPFHNTGSCYYPVENIVKIEEN